MILIRLTLFSLRNRWLSALLTIIAIALSVALFLGVEKVRTGARVSFADTISGTDLIVGSRTGGIQLLLYSVFRIGNATNNITWKSYQEIAGRREVAWAVPLSLGDSHRGFRVLGTSVNYFKHYRFRGGKQLSFAAGNPFSDLFDAVLGADVARHLGYRMGDPIVITHGLGEVSYAEHKDKPFRVAGILAKTGTPVDRTVHVSLAAIEAIHISWSDGARMSAMTPSAEAVRKLKLTPKAVTAMMIGVKSKLSTFRLQRFINEFAAEPLLAILPGVALQELWDIVGTAEQALTVVSAMVVAVAILGMTTMILSTLNERRREMAILRSVGARPATIVGLLMTEAGLFSLFGALLGVVLLYGGLLLARPAVDRLYGLYLPVTPPSQGELLTLVGIICAGIAISLLPALRAYRMSLADGMTIRS
jgi:putative ABC transport system permease protein